MSKNKNEKKAIQYLNNKGYKVVKEKNCIAVILDKDNIKQKIFFMENDCYMLVNCRLDNESIFGENIHFYEINDLYNYILNI
tara:strand:+ start:44 stop:289 length:246 start_codon:yes stop_codon:yes gene_type:complete